jgi:hypothetical protein
VQPRVVLGDGSSGENKEYLQKHAVDGRETGAALAEWLGVARGELALMRGHTGRDKTIAVQGLSGGKVRACLQAHAENP